MLFYLLSKTGHDNHLFRYCFVENLHKSGLMPQPDFVALDEWFNWIVKNHNVGGDLIGEDFVIAVLRVIYYFSSLPH